MQKIKVILFDLGNTLVYFKGDWDAIFSQAIDNMSSYLSKISHQEINPAEFHTDYKQALLAYYIQRDCDDIEKTTLTLLNEVLLSKYQLSLPQHQLIQILNEFYEHTGSHWFLDEDTIPTLSWLKSHGYRLGLISNAAHAPDVYAQLSKYHLTPYFEKILVSAEVGVRKPNSFIFEQAIAHFQTPPSTMVMVGDTLSADIIGSRKAGMKNIWVARWVSAPSNHYRDDAIVPDRKITSLAQITDTICNWL